MFAVTSGKSVGQAICVIIENLAGYMFQLSKLVVRMKNTYVYVLKRFSHSLLLGYINC